MTFWRLQSFTAMADCNPTLTIRWMKDEIIACQPGVASNRPRDHDFATPSHFFEEQILDPLLPFTSRRFCSHRLLWRCANFSINERKFLDLVFFWYEKREENVLKWYHWNCSSLLEWIFQLFLCQNLSTVCKIDKRTWKSLVSSLVNI